MNQAEALYEQLFNTAPCYLTVQDQDFRITHANKRFVDDFGNFEGRFCYQIYKNRSERCETCPVAKTFTDGQSHTSEEVVTCLDGRDVSVIAFTSPVRNEKGEITSVMELSADITEVKRLQNQLKDSRSRYRQLFEEVPCYITIQDKNLNIVESNTKFREDFGSFLGCPCFDVYKHRDEQCLNCPVQDTFRDGKVHRSEEVVTSRDGQQMNVLVYTAPIRNAQGEIEKVMEMSTNITPIRELQSQLESIGILISTISHGIKGLLTGLDGGTYLVNSGREKKDMARIDQGWEMVQRNISQIRNMVLNILYYSKDREPNYETISIKRLAEKVCTLFETKAKENDIVLSKKFDIKNEDIEADPNALQSLLVNLIENSIDALITATQKSDRKIQCSIKEDKNQVKFKIQDNGVGMDQETREKAFSLFFSSKGTQGTGLGLFISNKIAKSHGGRIDIDSELGKGTSFTVVLPRKRAL